MAEYISLKEIERKANKLITKYFSSKNKPFSLPIPVEKIAEHLLKLDILYDYIYEEKDCIIWGALKPNNRLVILNEAHRQEFDKYPGLLLFTFAHEIGHWELHVDQNILKQKSIPLSYEKPFTLCRDGDKSNIEVQANKFAAALVMPRDILTDRVLSITRVRRLNWEDINNLKNDFGVSKSAMVIRINELKLSFITERKIYECEEEANGQLSFL